MSPHSETSVTGPDPRPNKGLVSIVIASYGRPEMLARAIRSALSQSHSNLEVIVADDPTSPSCHHVIRGVNDPRFRFHLQDTRVGCWKNWTHAIRMARGEYIVFLGDDDWLSPAFVTDHLAALARLPGAAVSFCSMQEVLDENNTLRVIEPKPTRPCFLPRRSARKSSSGPPCPGGNWRPRFGRKPNRTTTWPITG